MERALKKLINLTKKCDIARIKSVLQEFDKYKKGLLFELYLTELYNGNGYFAKRVGKKNDMGADILLYSKTNPKDVIRVVQAKNHKAPLDKNRVRGELVKFEQEAESEYSCKYFSLVSVSGFSAEARKYEGFNSSLETWEYVEELIQHYKQVREVPIVHLFPHNKMAYENILKMWKRKNRVCAIQATGTGKSFLILKAMSDFSVKKKLILAPSTYILDQLRKNGGWVSEETTVYMSYQKLNNLSRSEMKELSPSLIVLDEFHRLGAKKWGEAVHQLLKIHSKSKVLGTSATPIRYLDGSRNMAKELFQGNEASNLSLSDAIIRGILPMPRYVCALYTIDEEMQGIENKIDYYQEKDQLKKKWKKKIERFKADWEHSNGISSVLKKHIGNERKFIVFCKDKEHLEQMEWLVESWFKKAKIASRIDRYRMMSKEKANQEQLDAFMNNQSTDSVKLLFSIDMLNEGLHIDSVDGVILLRPTESPIVFYQQIGRAIQANKKERPLIFDFVNNFSSIRANDFMKDMQESKKSYREKRKSLGLETEDIHFTISDETKEILEFEKEIRKRIENPWEWKYEELADYAEQNGNACLRAMDRTRYQELYQWCLQQRKRKEAGLLQPDEEQRLKKVGFLLTDEKTSHSESAEMVQESYIEPLHKSESFTYKLKHLLGKMLTFIHIRI